MPCTSLQEKLASACTSGIGNLNSRVGLLRAIAQNMCSASLVPPDPYAGKLIYTRSGLGTFEVVNPVGAYNLTFGSNQVTEIHCHDCPLITSITCTGSTLLTVIDLENCATLGNLVFDNCTALPSVNLDTFTSMSGSLSFHTCSSLASFSAVNLTNVDSNLFLILTSVVNASFPSLVSVGSLGVSGSSTVTLSAPNLVTIDVTLYCADSALLATINLPSLVSVLNIYTDRCNSLVSIELSSVQSIVYWDTWSCAILEQIVLPAYNSAYPISLNAYDCPNLTDILFDGYFDSGFFEDGSYWDCTGNAFSTTFVDSLLSRGVTDSTGICNVALDGGTNSPPTGGFANADYLTLTGLGWSITIN